MGETILSLVGLMLTASLINNVVLSQFLGLCPFLGVSKKTDTALGMGGACIFVITLASLVCSIIYKYILNPLDLSYLQTIVFILVIAMLVQFVEMILKKYIVSLYQALGVYLPLITTNCAVLGVAQGNTDQALNFADSMASAIGTGIGFALVIFIFSTIRYRLDAADNPKAFKGIPIALITAALMAMAFLGFSGMIK